MNKMKIATGHYINIYGKDGKDVYIIINEPNGVTDEMMLQATTCIEDELERKSWNDIMDKLEDIFPYGTHIVVRRG